MRVVIVDAESLGQHELCARLATEVDVDVVRVCATGREAVRAIRDVAPDLVFLEIHLPDIDGFEVLRRLPAAPVPLVVFVTALDDHALQAFEVQAVGYLRKPIDDARLRAAVERARLLSTSHRLCDFEATVRKLLNQFHAIRSRLVYRKRLAVRTRHRTIVVSTADIDWITATGDYVTLHVAGKEHLVRQTITSLEAELDPDRFLRIHRSTIVQAARIGDLVSLRNGEFLVRLRDGTELKTSRTYSERLARWL